jgi:Thioredoxin
MPVLHVTSAAEFDKLIKGDKGVRFYRMTGSEQVTHHHARYARLALKSCGDSANVGCSLRSSIASNTPHRLQTLTWCCSTNLLTLESSNRWLMMASVNRGKEFKAACEIMRVHCDWCVQVFVDFFAEWCGPCKMVAPKIEALSQEYPSIVFVKVDVDQASVRPRL